MLLSPTINNFHGRLLSITGTDPAAGAEISETVPDRRRWRLYGLSYSLVADSNPANRYVSLTIDDGTNNLFSYLMTNTQAENLAYTYHHFAQNVAEFRTGSRIYAPLPTLLLASGFRIRTTTTDLQVGDNFSAPQLLVEEWIDP